MHSFFRRHWLKKRTFLVLIRSAEQTARKILKAGIQQKLQNQDPILLKKLGYSYIFGRWSKRIFPQKILHFKTLRILLAIFVLCLFASGYLTNLSAYSFIAIGQLESIIYVEHNLCSYENIFVRNQKIENGYKNMLSATKKWFL